MAQRRWLTIVVFFLLSLLAAGALTYSQTPQYESKARIFISVDTSGGTSTEALQASVYASQRVQSYAELATSRELMQRVIARLNLNLTPDQLAGKVGAAVDANTVIIDLTVTDPSAGVAQQIAKAESEEFTSYITDLETPAGKTAPIKASVTSPASWTTATGLPRKGSEEKTSTWLKASMRVSVAAGVRRRCWRTGSRFGTRARRTRTGSSA